MSASIRLFHLGIYGWLALYLVALLGLGNAAWTNAPVHLFTPSSGPLSDVQALLADLRPGSCKLLCALALLSSLWLIARHRLWLALLVWLLFRIIDHRTWLASNGGIQLMSNMLLWSAFMNPARHGQIGALAFWLARLQLLLVYAVTAAHKFTGKSWLDGSAVLTVARDPDFHLGWLAGMPALCTLLTYAALAFMTLFPLAVWWRPSRRAFLLIGACFHLSTALFMDIPQMGFAFIVSYALWLDEAEASALLARIRVKRQAVITA